MQIGGSMQFALLCSSSLASIDTASLAMTGNASYKVQIMNDSEIWHQHNDPAAMVLFAASV